MQWINKKSLREERKIINFLLNNFEVLYCLPLSSMYIWKEKLIKFEDKRKRTISETKEQFNYNIT